MEAVKENVKKKKELDMLHGSIWNKIPLFALPVAATAILEQLFNASDVAVVGNFTGDLKTVSVAAVGANSAIVGLLVNLFVGIALGANVVIATAIGRNDKDAVQRAVHTAILMSVIGGAFVTLIGELIAGPLLQSLNVPADVYPLALLYLRIYLLGMPVILLYNFEAAIFRSVGETRVPLLALAISGVLNVLLNLFFVIVLKMNVNGVATATVISNAISAALLFRRLLKTNLDIQVHLKKLKIDWQSMSRILKIGLPAGIQSAMFSVSNVIIQAAINSLGQVVMAASSAAFNIEVFAYDVMNSFSQACTTFVGQNYGAGQMKRCKKTFAYSLTEAIIATALTCAIVLLSGRFLLSIFNNDPSVIEIGYLRLKIIFLSYVFTTLYDVMSGYMRGFGNSLVPALLTTLGVCVVRIAWIQIAFPKEPTFRTILTAYPISLAVTAAMVFVALLITRPAHKFEKEQQKNAVAEA